MIDPKVPVLLLGLAGCSESRVLVLDLQVEDGLGFFFWEDAEGQTSAPIGPVVVSGGKVIEGAGSLPDEPTEDLITASLHVAWVDRGAAKAAVEATGDALDESRLGRAKASLEEAACEGKAHRDDAQQTIDVRPSVFWQTAHPPEGPLEPSSPLVADQFRLRLPIAEDPCGHQGAVFRPFLSSPFLFPAEDALPFSRSSSIAADQTFRRVVRLGDDELLAFAGSLVYHVRRHPEEGRFESRPVNLSMDGQALGPKDMVVQPGSVPRILVVGEKYVPMRSAFMTRMEVRNGRLEVLQMLDVQEATGLEAAVFLPDGSFVTVGSTRDVEDPTKVRGIAFRGTWDGQMTPLFTVEHALSAVTAVDGDPPSLILGTESLPGSVLITDLTGVVRAEQQLGPRTKVKYRRFAPFGEGYLGVGGFAPIAWIEGERISSLSFRLQPRWASCPDMGRPNICVTPEVSEDAATIVGNGERVFWYHASCHDWVSSTDSAQCTSAIPLEKPLAQWAVEQGCTEPSEDFKLRDLDFATLERSGDVVTAVGACGLIVEACLDPTRCER